MTHKQTNSLSSIPFSWETIPGVPKVISSPVAAASVAKPEKVVETKELVPPPGPQQRCFREPIMKRSVSTIFWREEDPFLVALKECSKDYKAKSEKKRFVGLRSKSFLWCRCSFDVEEGNLRKRPVSSSDGQVIFPEGVQDSNSTLKNHITHPHCEALKRVAESGQSSMSRDRSIFVYNPDVLREQFAGLVIQRGLPFNQFDDEQTTMVFQNHLQPRYAHRVIAFEDFSVSHTGSALAKTLINVFVKFKLENKIMSIILDNASNNASAIGKLRLKYEPPMEDHLDTQERKQDKFTLETPVDFEEVILDAEVQANEAIPLSDEEIALDAASSECSMSGPGSGGEEADAKANYGYDVYHDDY
nr:zinc finger BED domain-containing protein RICESLEEPER 2-like [Tanacetum cinerariifolium]